MSAQSELVTKGFVREDARQAGKCRFTLAKEAVFTRQLSYLFPKGSPLTEIFNTK